MFSYQTFEHLPEPRPFLVELLRLTRRDGGSFSFIPIMETPEREAGFADWWYVMLSDHCAFYRHRTFERFLERTPHELL